MWKSQMDKNIYMGEVREKERGLVEGCAVHARVLKYARRQSLCLYLSTASSGTTPENVYEISTLE